MSGWWGSVGRALTRGGLVALAEARVCACLPMEHSLVLRPLVPGARDRLLASPRRFVLAGRHAALLLLRPCISRPLTK
jgi:hypothetical protein